jgi:arylsulfatase A
MMSTFAAIVGVELPEHAGEDSESILPALLGETVNQPVREATVHHSVFGMFAIRQRQWKVIYGRGSGGFSGPDADTVREFKWPEPSEPAPGEPAGQMYDLCRDLAETNNLWDSRPEIVEELSCLLTEYKATGSSCKHRARLER